ncbi:MAG: plastocyanin [Methanoregula sp. PtaU1.Bin051]|nr:MAG: plastocyanin [Methanoregula sp. PtaU1.Bin051]
MRKDVALLIILIAAGVFAGCSTQQPVTPPATVTTLQVPISTPAQYITTPVPTPLSQASVSDNTITIRDFIFSPQSITVKTGSIVRWENLDSVPHRIMFTDSSGRDTNVESSTLAPSQSYSRKFAAPGKYAYYCKIHPEMKGTVIVE